MNDRNKSIHPNPRNRKTAARRKVNHEKNKVARAELYSSHPSSDWNRNVGAWHSAIEALRLGTA